MGDVRRLRASTLIALVSTGTCYSLLPSAKPLVRPYPGYARCQSRDLGRTRSVAVCAVAVGRAEGKGKQSGQVDPDNGDSLDPTVQDQPHAGQHPAINSQGLAVGVSGDEHEASPRGRAWKSSRWYAVDNGANRTRSHQPALSLGSAATATATATAPSAPAKPKSEQRPGSRVQQDDPDNIELTRESGRNSPSSGSPRRTTISSSTQMGSAAAVPAPGSDARPDRKPRRTKVGGGVKGARASKATPSTAGGSLSAGDARSVKDKAAERSFLVERNEVDYLDEARASSVPMPIGRRWKKRMTTVTRTVRIWAFLFNVLVKLLRQKLVQRDEARMSARRRKLGKYLCRAFLKLGPTFIKIGQLLSTRVDLLSTEYIEELRQLQDNVPGFGGEMAMNIIERELGAPVSDLFDSFNATSLAAASLGQVHEAWLDGQRYAVKVQRPGLMELFEVDLKSIGALASVLDRFDPKLDGASRDWGAIFRESSRVLYEEVDYTREGKNAERFSENFKGTEWIKAPSINWSRSTSKVLCMEFLQGIKISELDKIDKAGVNRPLLAKRTAECYLAQLCRHGFFHCDPHPGNLACDNVDGGRIIFYDFGMMDELSVPLKREFVNLMFGIYGNDVTEVVDSLEAMDVIRKGADRMTVERVTRFYLGEFQTTLTKGGKYINQLDAEEEKALVRRERAKIGQELFSGGAAVPLQFPASFTFVFRAFTTLDGIGKTLDPNYDLTKIASPYLKELLDLKDGSAYVSVLKSWQKRLGWRGQDVASVVQSPRRVQHVNEVVTKLEEGDLRLRVRVLESEAAFARIEAVQGSLTAAVMAMLFLNAGVLLAGTTTASAMVGSRALLAAAGLFGVQIPAGYFKVWRLRRQAENTKGFR